MGELTERIFTPPGTDVGGRRVPAPVTRDDPAIQDAAVQRRRAAALAMGIGKTKLTAGLGDTDRTSRRPTLLGEVG